MAVLPKSCNEPINIDDCCMTFALTVCERAPGPIDTVLFVAPFAMICAI